MNKRLMRKQLLLLSFLAMAFNGVQAQEKMNNDTLVAPSMAQESSLETYNKWTVEINAGQSKGIKPYNTGYFYSDPTKHVTFDLNHYDIGVRYMISPKFGVKMDFNYDNFSKFRTK